MVILKLTGGAPLVGGLKPDKALGPPGPPSRRAPAMLFSMGIWFIPVTDRLRGCGSIGSDMVGVASP